MAVEFINSIFGQSLNSFLDMALLGVSLMIVWYIGKFFFVSPPTKEEKAAREAESDARRSETKKWVVDKYKKAEEKKKQEEEKGKRESRVKFVQAHLIKALQKTEYLKDSFKETTLNPDARARRKREKAVPEIHDLGKEIERNLTYMVHGIRNLRRSATGSLYKFFDELYAKGGNPLTRAEHLQTIKLDANNIGEWNAKKNEILDDVQQIIAGCGVLLEELEHYVKGSEPTS